MRVPIARQSVIEEVRKTSISAEQLPRNVHLINGHFEAPTS